MTKLLSLISVWITWQESCFQGS